MSGWRGDVVIAQTPTESEGVRQDGGPLEFIRIHAPQNKLHALASDQPPGYYMPMKRERFESALSKIRTNQSTKSAARIDRSTYTARFVEIDDQVYLEGSGDWHVELSPDWDSETEAMLPLGNCGIAIKGPLWKQEPPTRAEIGLDDREQATLAVPGSGVATFGWSLRGEHLEQVVRFPLRLPNAASRRLFLILPQRDAEKEV